MKKLNDHVKIADATFCLACVRELLLRVWQMLVSEFAAAG
jgi:hypothetical protein